MNRGSLFQINLLGTTFSIQTDQEETYLKELVIFFADKIKEVERSTSSNDPVRTAILAGILISDDFFKERRKTAGSPLAVREEPEEIEKITQEIIERLDRSLKEI